MVADCGNDPLKDFKSRGSIPLKQVNFARIYDYWLGGNHNFKVDRHKGDEVSAQEPLITAMVCENRAFLYRVVSYCLHHGVRQFLDLGSGLPTVGHIHEITHRRHPQARVVYVDHDQVAVAHIRHLLSDTDKPAQVLHADLGDVHSVLEQSRADAGLDFSQPIALLACSVLHRFADTEKLLAILGTYRAALATGSYLGLTHPTLDDPGIDVAAIAARLYELEEQIHPRSHTEVQQLFTGTSLVAPGVIATQHWRPDTSSQPVTHSGLYAGLGRIPAS